MVRSSTGDEPESSGRVGCGAAILTTMALGCWGTLSRAVRRGYHVLPGQPVRAKRVYCRRYAAPAGTDDSMPSSLIPTVTLRAPSMEPEGQVVMPVIGYGVGTAWYKTGSEGTAARRQELKSAIHAALDTGFRHIDDAEMYENSKVTGEVIGEWLGAAPGRRRREDLFITHKVANIDDRVALETCEQLLDETGLEYFDLFLIHSPCQPSGHPWRKSLAQAWTEMQEVVRQGRARAIGVSNFRIADLSEILDACAKNPEFVPPSCNQVEGHVFLQQENLLQFCEQNNIVVTAYGAQIPLTKGYLSDTSDGSGAPAVNDAVQSSMALHGKTAGQVLLRWAIQTGRVPITTSGRVERMQEYLDVLRDEDFVLSDSEIESISGSGRRARQRRQYWTQCEAYFAKDPGTEPESGGVVQEVL